MTTYRPSRLTRFLQCIQCLFGMFLIIVALATGIYTSQFNLFFLIISLVVIAWILWFICRKSLEIAFKHGVTLTDKGITWRYLGVSGFASWETITHFDSDHERAWLNMTYSTSDKRHVHIRVPAFRAHIPLRNNDIWGIRLNAKTQLKTTWLSNLPSGSHDFVPLSLILKLPRHHDKSLDLEKLAQTELGQMLYHYAPHLFEKSKDINHT